MSTRFDSLSISPAVLKAIQEMGFEEATAIQSQAIPVLLEGKDVLGQAQTGTGKTVAFGIPAIEKIDVRQLFIQVLVLCPTRELAIQVCEELKKLARFIPGLQMVPIYGGQSIDRQMRALRAGVQMVIGTPGRVMDLMEKGALKLDRVKMIVLDEADEMLNMGFREDIEWVLERSPKEPQTVFFSATMPKQILALTKNYQKTPVHIKIEHKELTVSNIEQFYIEVPERQRLEALARLVDILDPKLALVFCNTKRRVNEVISELQARGYFADGLHGDLKQNERNAVLDKFKKGIVDILVATDVAARGLDVEDIEVVFNMEVPMDEEMYIHRIGRTGRAGRSGKSYTFAAGREMYHLRDIERYTRSKMALAKVPSLTEVEEKKVEAVLEEIKTTMLGSDLSRYIQLTEQLMGDQLTSMDVAAALLKLHLSPAKEGEKIEFSQTGSMARLFVNIGRKQRVQAKDIVGAITSQTGLAGKVIGTIDIYEEFTFVEVPQEHAAQVIDAMKNNQIKGQRITMQPARKR